MRRHPRESPGRPARQRPRLREIVMLALPVTSTPQGSSARTRARPGPAADACGGWPRRHGALAPSAYRMKLQDTPPENYILVILRMTGVASASEGPELMNQHQAFPYVPFISPAMGSASGRQAPSAGPLRACRDATVPVGRSEAPPRTARSHGVSCDRPKVAGPTAPCLSVRVSPFVPDRNERARAAGNGSSPIPPLDTAAPACCASSNLATTSN
jgi:hypothetical protein